MTDPTRRFYEAVFAWRESGSTDGLDLLTALSDSGLEVRTAADTARPDWQALLRAVIVGQEYDRMEAEGKAAEALGLTWDDGPGAWVCDIEDRP